MDLNPFPHLVIDDYLDEWLADYVIRELSLCDTSGWEQADHQYQVNKRWMSDPMRLPQLTADLLTEMNDPETLRFMSAMTGIRDLIPDPTYLGGGVHVTESGGLLGVHADFNLHPTTGYHRRLNALLFLNPGWLPEWGGQLELWEQDLSRCAKVIEPIHNRLVVFPITDTAYHGVRPVTCPPNRKRWSLALYYYTADRPEEEKAPFHWAAWQDVRTLVAPAAESESRSVPVRGTRRALRYRGPATEPE